MNLHFEYLPYRRNFDQPLVTAHGVWRVREGIVLRLEDANGRVGFGEIAPVPWFGTELLDQAEAWCNAQSGKVSTLIQAPSNLPCCGFALATALEQLAGEKTDRVFAVAALSSSKASLEVKQAEGFSTFKTKIGARPFGEESNRVEELLSRLLPGQFLRLDANGGLSESTFKAWLEFLEGQPVEFLEQPLTPGLEHQMLEIAEPFSTPIALDESVTGGDSLLRWTDWPGPLVVKASLLGHPPATLPPRALGSSVFETAFGFEGALRYLASHQQSDTAIGFGTTGFLEPDGWSLHNAGPLLQAGAVTDDQLQVLWEEKA